MGFNDKQQHLLLENENSLYALVSTHKEIYYLAELYEFLALSPHLLFSSPPWPLGCSAQEARLARSFTAFLM